MLDILVKFDLKVSNVAKVYLDRHSRRKKDVDARIELRTITGNMWKVRCFPLRSVPY